MQSKKKKIILIAAAAAAAVIIAVIAVTTRNAPVAAPAESGSPIDYSQGVSSEESAKDATLLAEAQALANADLANSAAPSAPAIPEGLEDRQQAVAEYTGGAIAYEYYDITADKTIEETQPAKEKTVSYPLEVAADKLFSLPLDESPLAPNSIAIFDGENIVIDFNAKIYDVPMGIVFEEAMLGTIANMYLDNMENITRIYFSVDGKNYASGHFELNKDVPYGTK
ncbi:MAG TPA: hypothetical protein DEB31_04615 [Clostridiales bacterium]|nr:hypothetical protein [Clostridiales bacterium]